jgi:membrane protein YqaA with SNARE-associated domain
MYSHYCRPNTDYLAKQGHMPGLIYLSIMNVLGNRLLPLSLCLVLCNICRLRRLQPWLTIICPCVHNGCGVMCGFFLSYIVLNIIQREKDK